MDMIAKRSKARELVLTAAGGRIEPVERRFGKRVEKAPCGIALRGRAVELWKEGGRRATALSEELPEDEAWVREDMPRAKNFDSLAMPFFYIRKVAPHKEDVGEGGAC
jgi:hypothetical protein